LKGKSPILAVEDTLLFTASLKMPPDSSRFFWACIFFLLTDLSESIMITLKNLDKNPCRFEANILTVFEAIVTLLFLIVVLVFCRVKEQKLRFLQFLSI